MISVLYNGSEKEEIFDANKIDTHDSDFLAFTKEDKKKNSSKLVVMLNRGAVKRIKIIADKPCIRKSEKTKK
jgi:hypothetical protein